MAELTVDLDRSSPVPLYFQVSRQIEAAIERGDLGPGDRLENEISLADRWGLSRPTMRRAIEELVDKGLLVRRRGIGTQVVHGRVKRRMDLTSLYDDLARSDQQPATQVLTPGAGRRRRARGRAARACRSAPRCCTWSGCATPRGEPLAVMRNWLPVELAGRAQRRGAGVARAVRADPRHRRAPADRQPADRRPRGDRAGGEAAPAAEGRAAADHGAHDVRRVRPAVELGIHAYRAETYSIEMTVVGRSARGPPPSRSWARPGGGRGRRRRPGRLPGRVRRAGSARRAGSRGRSGWPRTPPGPAPAAGRRPRTPRRRSRPRWGR